VTSIASVRRPDASALFVLGGSGAQGFSASSGLRAWHVLLEGALRRKLGKPNLYVFNAAMGGFVAFQEKLAFYLAVAARAPAAVLFYDSYNDVILQPISGTRPGDRCGSRPGTAQSTATDPSSGSLSTAPLPTACCKTSSRVR
jgi:hypothetical protein